MYIKSNPRRRICGNERDNNFAATNKVGIERLGKSNVTLRRRCIDIHLRRFGGEKYFFC